MATKKAVPLKAPARSAAPDHSVALKNYESALKTMQEKKYDRAKIAFETLLAVDGLPPFISDRARLYHNACVAKLTSSTPGPKSPTDQYDYAVALMNRGDFDGARTTLERLMKNAPDADYGHYGMAVLSCVTHRPEDAMRHLERAIELNPQNRIHARNDADFQMMADDPRFTELLYPEELGNQASPHWRS